MPVLKYKDSATGEFKKFPFAISGGKSGGGGITREKYLTNGQISTKSSYASCTLDKELDVSKYDFLLFTLYAENQAYTTLTSSALGTIYLNSNYGANSIKCELTSTTLQSTYYSGNYQEMFVDIEAIKFGSGGGTSAPEIYIGNDVTEAEESQVLFVDTSRDYPGGDGSLPDYSYDEHKTGRKWVDGSDIWERTLVYHHPTQTSATVTIKHEIDIGDYYLMKSATWKRTLTSGKTTDFNQNDITKVVLSKDTLYYSFVSYNAYVDDLYITIEYTKNE